MDLIYTLSSTLKSGKCENRYAMKNILNGDEYSTNNAYENTTAFLYKAVTFELLEKCIKLEMSSC